VAEEPADSVVAAINDKDKTNPYHSKKTHFGVNTVVDDAKFKKYLQDKALIKRREVSIETSLDSIDTFSMLKEVMTSEVPTS
jgi:hypothetical protein